MSNFIAIAKAEHYNENDLIDLENEKRKSSIIHFNQKNNPPDNETVSSYFSEMTLDSVLKVQAT
ncbi:MAG: hypothetical protein IPM91_16095 [Bacteroidetes bacterium]|nr:hypothetical protein [Bacteroidota bacterium]